jgi:anti-sigma factor RsiW
VNCDQASALVGAYADGEIDGLKRQSVAKHIRGCAACAAKHADILALRERIRAEVPYYAAPPGFRERMQALAVSAAPARPVKTKSHFSWWGAGALAGSWRDHVGWLGSGAVAGCAVTALAFVLGTNIIAWREGQDLTTQAVARHVRATLDHRLIEVASSDQHTVKPWLSARLDYSPPVRDLAADGFPLLGGRLDTIEGRPCATLVYGYRKHTIDVFVRPEASDAPPLRESRGFNVAHARGAGFDWTVVSDAGADILEAFVRQLISEASQPSKG